MPYTEEFLKLRRKIGNQYSDKAKAETFAYKNAFDRGIKTWEERKPKRIMNMWEEEDKQ